MALRYLLSSSPPLSPISGRRPSFSTSPAISGVHFAIPAHPSHYSHRSCTLNSTLATLIKDALPNPHPSSPSANNLGLDVSGSSSNVTHAPNPLSNTSANSTSSTNIAHGSQLVADYTAGSFSRQLSSVDSQAVNPNSISPRSLPSAPLDPRVPGPIALPGSLKLVRSSSFPTTQALAALGATILANLKNYIHALYQSPPDSVTNTGELVRSSSRASVRSSSSVNHRTPSIGLIIGGALTTYLQLSNLDEDVIVYLLMDTVEVDCKQLTFIRGPPHKRTASSASLESAAAHIPPDSGVFDEDESEWDTEMLFEALYKRNFADLSQLYNPQPNVITPPSQRKPSMRK